MSRRRAELAVILALIAPWGAPAPSLAQSPAESLDAYLVEHGLTRLRARMLEHELEAASGDQRLELAERLAELYSQELEATDSPEQQREWERLARNLLAAFPELQSVAMRLELAKARFAGVERIAEEWRLRMVSEPDRIIAQQSLEELATEFRDMAGKAHMDVRTLEAQEESVYAGDTDLIGEALARARQQRSIAHYLAGWCLLYLAEMAPTPTEASSRAGDAAEAFSWLVNSAPSRVPALDRVPEQLLKYEHMARAAIAVGACEALRGDISAALAWLDLVENAPELPTGVSSPLFARRVWILARDGRWDRIAALVADRRDAGSDAPGEVTPLTVGEARLLAVLCIEARPPSQTAEQLLPVAIADLIARGEHAHLLDLSRRYSSSELNLTGFLAHHVRGVRLYDQARAAQRTAGEDEQQPTRTDSIGAIYTDAAKAFGAAEDAPDAGRFPGSRAGNLMLKGMSLYFAGRYAGPDAAAEATEALLAASELSTAASMGSESMWMAIRVLESHLERSPDDAASRARMLDLMTRFTERYPSSPRTGEIALRRALKDNRPDEQSLRLLLAVPEGTPQYEAARRHAENMAYELYRAGSQSESSWLAARYVAIAEPLLTLDQRLALQGDADAANGTVLRCRRMVDALLAMSPPDHDRAGRVLDVLRSMLASGRTESADLEGELAFRRAQIALARGDEQAAVAIVESIRARDPELAESASRLVVRHIARRWSDAEPGSPSRLSNARRLIDIASPIVSTPADTEALRADPREAALRVMVGEAAIELWRADQSAPMLALADRLARELRPAFGNDARVLTIAAETAEARGDLVSALDDWRTLVAATQAGTDLWFERRLRQLSLLARVEPDRAREALAQHRTLYPGLAPEPYKAGFLDLERRLGAGDNEGERP